MGRSRLRTAGAGLALMALVAGCSQLDATSAFPARHSSTSSGPAGAWASAGVGAPTPLSTSAAPTAAAPSAAPAAIGPPSVYRGTDDQDLPITKPAGSRAVIVTITGNADGHNFNVRALDGAQDHLVATTSPYSGSTLLDVAGTTTHRLRVHAVGAWSITLTDERSAPVFSVVRGGTGDGVFLSGAGGPVLIRAEGAGTPFSVRTYGPRGMTDVVRATGPWTGSADLPSRDAIVAVRAVGPWSVTAVHVKRKK